MEQSTIEPSTIPTSAADMLAHLKSTYPAYYRSWKSMTSCYGVHVIALEWRGTIGLMRFIEDTSELPGNPSTPINQHNKLKRIDSFKQFDASNVMWKTPKVAVKKQQMIAGVIQDALEARNEREAMYAALHSTVPPIQEDKALTSLTNLTTLSTSEQEARLNELVMLQFSGTQLTEEQEVELSVLSKLVTDTPVASSTHVNKYENI